MKSKFDFKKFRPVGIFLAILAALLIYAYGFQVTKVNLEETRSEKRQTQLVRIIRALAKPDLITYDYQETEATFRIRIPCPPEGFQPTLPKEGAPYLKMTPACANPKDTITVEGENFPPNASGPLYFIPPSEVTLSLGTIQTDSAGHFSMTVKLPDRPAEEDQYIRALVKVPSGVPRASAALIDTWDKIVETVFLALLATTLGTLLAVPLSFFAARNLMKDVTSPFISVALYILLIPLGILAGAQIARWAISLRLLLGITLWVDGIGIIVLPLALLFLFRWSVPQTDEQKPSWKLRIARALALLLAYFLGVLTLSFVSNILIEAGNFIQPALGSFGFIGKFVRDCGDILGMILTILSALVGGGVLLNIANRFGEYAIRHFSFSANRLLNLIIGTVSGAGLAVMLMAGIDWLYQFDNRWISLYFPAGIGGLLGLLMALRFKPRDKVGIGMVVYFISRTIFNALRSIEALIMVIVFVVWVGIGPFAGVLALSLHTIAALAKLYSEQVESILPGPIEAVKATGANRLQTIVYAVIPQIVPPYISFTMYRWDINVRMSTIIGFAGGGGIGFLLIQNINLLNYRAASVQMIAIALVVASMDYLSSKLRENMV